MNAGYQANMYIATSVMRLVEMPLKTEGALSKGLASGVYYMYCLPYRPLHSQ